jgi:LPS export ABC transporter protein LptC
MRLKSLVTLLFLVLVAFLIWWFRLVDDRPVNLLTRENPHFIDAYMRDFKLTAMNAEGKPGYTLRAHEFNHYNDQDIATLQKPVIHLEHTNSNWQLSAQDGEINDAQNQIVLYNKVVMQQLRTQAGTDQNSQPGVQLRTERLDIDTNKQLATSDQLTQIDYKHVSLSSLGFRLDNLKGQLDLLAEVTGVYAVP